MPGADEKISYDIPALTIDGEAIVYFAGWTRHVSVYPIPDGDADYERELAPFRSGASTAKFPLSKPIPFDLIGRITKLLVEQHGRAPASPKKAGRARSENGRSRPQPG